MRSTSTPALARRVIALAALTAALSIVLVGAVPAGAAVQRSVTSFSFPTANPCTGEPGTLSGTETASMRVTVNDNHFLFGGSSRTDETFTPDDPASPPATGHGTFNFSFVANDGGGGTTVYSEVQTDVFHASGATVVIHHIVHTTVVGGEMIVSVERPLLVCQTV